MSGGAAGVDVGTDTALLCAPKHMGSGTLSARHLALSAHTRSSKRQRFAPHIAQRTDARRHAAHASARVAIAAHISPASFESGLGAI